MMTTCMGVDVYYMVPLHLCYTTKVQKKKVNDRE